MYVYAKQIPCSPTTKIKSSPFCFSIVSVLLLFDTFVLLYVSFNLKELEVVLTSFYMSICIFVVAFYLHIHCGFVNFNMLKITIL